MLGVDCCEEDIWGMWFGVVFTWGWVGVGRVRGLRVRGCQEGEGSVVMLLGIVRDCSWAR